MKRITVATSDSFLLEVESEEQGRELRKMTEVAGRKCTVSPHDQHNQRKGIIYVQKYDIDLE